MKGIGQPRTEGVPPRSSNNSIGVSLSLVNVTTRLLIGQVICCSFVYEVVVKVVETATLVIYLQFVLVVRCFAPSSVLPA